MPAWPIFDVSGGLNTTAPPPLLADNELWRAHNVLLRQRGFEKRPGYRRICTAAGDAATQKVMGLHIFTTPAGVRHIVRIRNALIENYDASTPTNWADITGSMTPATTIRTKMDVFRGNIVGTDTVDVPWKWAGSGNAAAITNTIDAGADTIDKAATLVVHRERLVLGDVTATESAVQSRYESVIWPSTAGTLDTWTSAPDGKIHLGQGDGDSITAMVSLLGYLVVFKQHSIWRVSDYGVADTQVALRVGNVGTANRFGAIVVDSLVYFLDDEFRLWSYDPRQGDSPDALQEHTGRTTSLFERARLAEDTDTGAARGLVYWPDQRVILAFCGDRDFDTTPTTPNCAWVYHIDLGHARTKWNFLDDWTAYAYGLSDYAQHPALILGSTDGYVARVLGDRTDDATGAIAGTATAIDMDAYFAPTGCGDADHIKKWNWAYVYTNSQQLLFNGGDAPTADSITLGLINVLPEDDVSGNPLSFTVSMPDQGDLYESVAEQRLSGHGRFVQFRIRQNSSRHIRVSGLLLNYTQEGERR